MRSVSLRGLHRRVDHRSRRKCCCFHLRAQSVRSCHRRKCTPVFLSTREQSRLRQHPCDDQRTEKLALVAVPPISVMQHPALDVSFASHGSFPAAAFAAGLPSRRLATRSVQEKNKADQSNRSLSYHTRSSYLVSFCMLSVSLMTECPKMSTWMACSPVRPILKGLSSCKCPNTPHGSNCHGRVQLQAPLLVTESFDPGQYRLTHLNTQDCKTIGKAPITVVPRAQAPKLCVVSIIRRLQPSRLVSLAPVSNAKLRFVKIRSNTSPLKDFVPMSASLTVPCTFQIRNSRFCHSPLQP